jgi:anaerobic magnesium-protoporphyrin IX monomethyl ester cyclase
MRLLLLNPPNPKDLQANRDYMGNYGMLNTKPGVVLPPLHLIQMGGTIDSNAFDFLDAAAEDLSVEVTRQKISAQTYSHVIILTSTPTFDLDCAIARWTKENTKATVYLYGPHPAHVAKEAFEKSCADGILVGYTPKTLSKLMESSQPPSDLVELVLPDKIPSPPPIAPSFNMDDLPFGCWDKTPLRKYRFHVYEPTPFATMRSSLGCVYSCAYCPYVLAEGQRFLPMSPERTYAEMEYLSKEHGIRFILFRDLLFTAQKKRIEQLCELLIQKPLKLAWRCETSTNHLTPDLIKSLARAGCTGLNLGVESVDETSASEMDLISKRKDLEHLRAVFETCAEVGIRTNALFVIGFPEDSRLGIQKSIDFARNLNAASVQFSFATPFPGTELANISDREHLTEMHSWSDFSSLRPVMRTRHLSREEVQQLGRKALRDVYFQPKRILKLAANPIQFARRAHAFLRFYVGH